MGSSRMCGRGWNLKDELLLMYKGQEGSLNRLNDLDLPQNGPALKAPLPKT